MLIKGTLSLRRNTHTSVGYHELLELTIIGSIAMHTSADAIDGGRETMSGVSTRRARCAVEARIDKDALGGALGRLGRLWLVDRHPCFCFPSSSLRPN